jgi:hypothetical protein
MDNLLYRLTILNDLIRDVRREHSEIGFVTPMIKSYLKRMAIEIDSDLKIIFSFEGQNELIIHNDFLGDNDDNFNYWTIVIDNKDLYENNYEKFSYQLCKIRDGIPIFSVIGIPKQQVIYIARKGLGSFRKWKDLCPKKMRARVFNNRILINGNVSLENQNYGILDLINENDLGDIYPEEGVKKMLSIAEGRANFYPCLYKTKTWETCSAQLICEEAGCSVLEVETKKSLTYNINKRENVHFVVLGGKN